MQVRILFLKNDGILNMICLCNILQAKANAMTKECVRFTIESHRSKSSDEITNNNNNNGMIVECACLN